MENNKINKFVNLFINSLFDLLWALTSAGNNEFEITIEIKYQRIKQTIIMLVKIRMYLKVFDILDEFIANYF